MVSRAADLRRGVWCYVPASLGQGRAADEQGTVLPQPAVAAPSVHELRPLALHNTSFSLISWAIHDILMALPSWYLESAHIHGPSASSAAPHQLTAAVPCHPLYFHLASRPYKRLWMTSAPASSVLLGPCDLTCCSVPTPSLSSSISVHLPACSPYPRITMW